MSDEMQYDLDAAYAVDDQMQEEIDKLKADPWELLPSLKDGFQPKGLSQDAPDGSEQYEEGFREKWTQTEYCEIEDAGLRPLTNRDNKDQVDGHIAFVTLKCTDGPNSGKRIDKSWWLRDGDRDAVQQMNADLQEIFGRFQIEPTLVELPDGREVPSYTATLPELKGLPCQIALQQKWAHPWTKDDSTGEWKELTDEPKKYKKKIFSIKPA